MGHWQALRARPLTVSMLLTDESCDRVKHLRSLPICERKSGSIALWNVDSIRRSLKNDSEWFICYAVIRDDGI